MNVLASMLGKAMPQLIIRENEPLSLHTSFHIGGPAAVLAFPADTAELSALVRFARENEVPLRILGGGTNLLVCDEGVDALVVRLPAQGQLALDGDALFVGAGVGKAFAAQAAADAGLAGLEFFHGIPGTVGGGVRMNAGAYGGETAQSVVRVTAMDENGNIRLYERDSLDFGYRHSLFSEHPELVVLSAEFALTPDDPEAIRSRMRELAARRREKQPLEYPSAGSVFKRPEGYYAGKLIEDAGLKGFSIGGAQVSEKHAGFIINRGGASAKDVKALVAHIQKTVLDAFGVQLVCEIEMWEK